jgi:hypothetical protein
MDMKRIDNKEVQKENNGLVGRIVKWLDLLIRTVPEKKEARKLARSPSPSPTSFISLRWNLVGWGSAQAEASLVV